MAKSGTVPFYNGVATTSFRNDPGVVLTDECDAPTSAKIMSFGGWVKRNKIGHYSNLFSGSLGGANVPQSTLYFDTDNALKSISYTGSAYVYDYRTTQLFRDISAWYHIWVQIDTTDGTQTDRFKLYANGVRITSFSNAGLIADGNPDIRGFNEDGITAYFGHTNTSYGGNVYYSDWYFIDGSAVSPVDTVGEFKNGVFIPKSYSPTFGNNGFNLKFDQVGVGSPSSSTIGADSSGSSRHFISTAGTDAVASDCAMPDSPENNFTTLNPLMNYGETSRVVSKGNLKFSDSVNNSYYARIGANLPFEGKWYWEVLISGNISSYFFANGTCNIEDNNNIVSQSTNSSELTGPHIIAENGKYYDGSLTAEYTGFSTGDILQVYFDADIGSLFMGRNNTAFNSGSAVATSLPAQEIHCAMANTGSVDGSFSLYNFGQDSSFAGNKTAQGNTDGNGIGDFYYAPPSGFLAICTSNLPEPTIGPNSDTQSDDHFNTVLYTGNANARSITGVGFQPDWVWIKTRSAGLYHFLTDSSRGVTHTLSSNTNDNEDFSSEDVLSAFGSDGFTLTADDGSGYYGWNRNNDTLVAWNWKANGGTATATISESGDNPAASVQANPTAGFSIVTYTGTGDTGTIAHGLGAVPTWILIKNRDVADAWAVYHGSNTSAPATDYLVLNTTAATVDAVGWWDDTAPTSSVFTVHDQHSVNADGEKYVAYVFADVKGYSKFGVYTGTGNANGPFVFTGFRPAFIIRKKTNAVGDWIIMDTSRDPANLSDDRILANSNVAEANNGNNIDILSNGFKERNADGYSNANGSTYLYMAFAESPFKYANAK